MNNIINNLTTKQLILLGTCLCAGTLFFLLRYEWIIIRIPGKRGYLINNQPERIIKKKVTLYHWNQNAWQTETEELIWSDKATVNIQTIINALLRLFEQEQVMRKRITVESTACTPSEQECYISFDHNPLNKEWSTFHAWMIIESMLRTIAENEITIAGIYFLVRHQPLQDQRLDFSNMWPIAGFRDK